MTRLLIPDSGPLFSLAAGDLLDLLSNFRLGITDLVKEETFDRGLNPGCSMEARRLLDFYIKHRPSIIVYPTQVGADLAAQRKLDPGYPTPPNLGELSIQSLLIHLQVTQPAASPMILFEDGWFLRNAAGLAKPCVLLGTKAFLINAEKYGLIASAAGALQAIADGNRNLPDRSDSIEEN